MLSLLGRLAMGGDARRPAASVPNFEALTRSSPEDIDRLRQLVEAVNAEGGAYHRLDFGRGLSIAGDYDLRRYLHLLPLPASLAGSRVLDVGTASGFFALECARRGARVTAIDLYDCPLLARLAPLLKADISYVQTSIYDLEPPAAAFDLVVCGSVLLHLPDPVGAIRRIHDVCGGQALISTACPSYSRLTSRPVCELQARKAADGDYFHWWDLGAAALTRMLLAAGFSAVTNVRHFTLRSEPGRAAFATPHVVLRARK